MPINFDAITSYTFSNFITFLKNKNPDPIKKIDSLFVDVDEFAILNKNDAKVAAIHYPARAVAHWHDRLGLRLALDREFEDRGVRLQFFRSGGITLEFASRTDERGRTPGTDAVYGVSYRVHDLAACRARLLERGLDVSEIRPGMKEGTRVASVRDGTAAVPTLLIEPASEA
jgi:hypothetical protein